jgi:hypothetical protein
MHTHSSVLWRFSRVPLGVCMPAPLFSPLVVLRIFWHVHSVLVRYVSPCSVEFVTRRGYTFDSILSYIHTQ